MFFIKIAGEQSAVYETTDCPIEAIAMLIKYQERGYRPVVHDDLDTPLTYPELKRLAAIAERRADLQSK